MHVLFSTYLGLKFRKFSPGKVAKLAPQHEEESLVTSFSFTKKMAYSYAVD